MKNFIVIDCDQFRKHSILNNLENDKKMFNQLWKDYNNFFSILYIRTHQQLSITCKNNNYYYYYYYYYIVLCKTAREHLSFGLYLFKKQLNKWTSACNSNLYKFRELTFGEKIKNRTFFDSTFRNSQIWKFEKIAVGHSAIRQYANNIRPEKFRLTIFQRQDSRFTSRPNSVSLFYAICNARQNSKNTTK